MFRSYTASPIERWAFFLQNVHRLTREDVLRLFPDSEFAEAAGVLEMISQTPEQQRLYDARLKFQLDNAARIELAREEGRQQGELLGRIALLQELLGITAPDRNELSGYDIKQLSALTDELQQQLRNRGD